MSSNSACNHTHDSQIRILCCSRPILSVTWMITDQNGLRSLLLPLLSLYTLTLVCIFSIMLFKHFLRCWQGEFVSQSKASFPGDHFLYSNDLNNYVIQEWYCRAKNWQLHSRQWQAKTDQGHTNLRFECLMCDYATEFQKVAM